jgi:hypothetical protein
MKYTLRLFIATLAFWAAGLGHVWAQSSNSLVPADFEVPEEFQTEKFILLPLSPKVVIEDYEAVMTSIEHLRSSGHMHGNADGWPSPQLTFATDLGHLKGHYRKFLERLEYAYTVLSPDKSVCLGCVYIQPTQKPGYDVRVRMWVRKSEFDKDLDLILFEAVKDWIEKDWPFENPGYPGREIDWVE